MCVLAQTARRIEAHRVLRPTPNSGAMASCSTPKARAHTWRTKQSAHDGGCVLLRWARCLFAHVTFHVTLAGQSIVQRRQMAPTQPWLRLAAIGRPVCHARKRDAAHSRVHDTAAPHPPSHCQKRQDAAEPGMRQCWWRQRQKKRGGVGTTCSTSHAPDAAGMGPIRLDR